MKSFRSLPNKLPELILDCHIVITVETFSDSVVMCLVTTLLGVSSSYHRFVTRELVVISFLTEVNKEKG